MTRILLFLVLINVVHSKLKWDLLSANNGSASFPGPAPRRDSSIGYNRIRKELIVFGGKGDDGFFNDTWIFRLANRSWTKINTGSGSTPEKRFSMVFGAADDSFYISTGEGTEPRRFFNDIWQYKFDADQTWERLDDPKAEVQPEERYGSAGGIFDDGKSGNGFYITHGFSGTRYSNTFRFDFTTKKWQEKFHGSNSYNPSYPHSRCLHSGTLTKPDELVIYGGCLGGGGTGGPCPAEDSWKFDATKTEWTRLEECSTPRIYSAMAMLPPLNDTSVRRAVMYGGGETSKSVLVTPEVEANEIAVFDPDTNKWQRKKVEGTAPIKRSSHVMVTTDDGIVMFGGSGGGFLNDLWLLNGTASDADDLESAGSCGSADFNLIMLHGIFMFLGWGVFLQLGAFIARYFRHKADGWWFKMHRIFQVTGLVFAFAGLICGVISVPSGHFRFAHAPIGLVIMIIGLTQPLNAFFRPHKHEDGSRSTTRLVWELFHKNIGRVALILALINISLGLFLAVVPTAAWAVWYALLGIFVCVYIVMEIRLQISHRKTNTVAFPLQGK